MAAPANLQSLLDTIRAVQELQQLVHVQDQRILLRHRCLVAVETVDHNGLDCWILRRTRWANSPGDSSAAACWLMMSFPEARMAARSKPSGPGGRTAARSPRRR